MKVKQTIVTIALLAGASIFLTSPVSVLAKAGDPCGSATLKDGQNCCGGVVTTLISCDQTGGGTTENTGIWGVLMLVINIMSAGIGVLAVGGIAYGSVMYASAGGNPEKSKKARLMITNVVVGLLMYILMFALLNYLVPGGLFRAATP